jgi:NAD(P)-dependent dehydrogenase (short-subunit alcohol dehydrogenase family)
MGTLVMTGASQGFGRHAAKRLLTDHPDQHLVLLARSGADRLAAELTEETGNANVSGLSCDLASLQEIRVAAAAIDQRLTAGELPPLTGFLGNAGVQRVSTAEVSADGFEITFAVNVLANYLLLRLLLDRFQAPGRIVLLGSDLHFGDFRHNLGVIPAPHWTSTTDLATSRPGGVRQGRGAYATSKLGVVYLVHALARRLPEGVDAYTYSPNLVPGTNLWRAADPVSRFVSKTVLHATRLTPIAMGPVAAGRLLADTMMGPRPGESGSYIDRGKIVPSSAESYDHSREKELWLAAAELCGVMQQQPPAVS